MRNFAKDDGVTNFAHHLTAIDQKRSAHQALQAAKRNCWKYTWVGAGLKKFYSGYILLLSILTSMGSKIQTGLGGQDYMINFTGYQIINIVYE